MVVIFNPCSESWMEEALLPFWFEFPSHQTHTSLRTFFPRSLVLPTLMTRCVLCGLCAGALSHIRAQCVPLVWKNVSPCSTCTCVLRLCLASLATSPGARAGPFFTVMADKTLAKFGILIFDVLVRGHTQPITF